jgi:glycosyltransferase involved in cell wall biosynthesis
MTDVAARLDTSDPADSSYERVRVGFLAQENLPVPPPSLGGSVSRVVYELARELATGCEGRYDVTVCSRHHAEVPEGAQDGVRYLRVGVGRDAQWHALYTRVLRVLQRLDLPYRDLQGAPFYAHGYAAEGLHRLVEVDPEVVHLQNVSQFLPLARRLVPRAKLVLHMHCDWLRQLPASTVRRRLSHADLVLGVSDYITDGIRERYPDHAPRCQTLHNGAEVDFFLPRNLLPPRLSRLTSDLRLRFGLGDGPLVFYVGGFAADKGITCLLRAFRATLDEVPDARLLLVGAHNRYFQVRSPRGRRARVESRRAQQAYPHEVEQLLGQLRHRAIVAGRVPHDELPAYYALADVYTMPSTSPEPFSLTVPEAMSCGLPVVGTAHGGTPEIVDQGGTGLLVPPGDEAALARALVRLCRDPALAATMGARGRALVAQRFTWRIQALRLAAYYDELVGVQPCPI